MSRAVLILALVAAMPAGAAESADRFLGRTLPDWFRDLTHRDPTVRRSAAFAVGKFGSTAVTSLGDLVRILNRDADASVRDMVAVAVGEILADTGLGKDSLWPEIGPDLLRAAREDSSPAVRRSAVYAVGNFGPLAEPAREVLVAGLRDADASVRQNVAWALGQLGAAAGKDGVDALAAALRDAEPMVQRDAAQALAAVGAPVARPAVGPLLDLVRQTRNEAVLQAALEPLSVLAGPEERAAVSLLVPLLEHEDLDTRRLAAFALARIGGNGARPALRVLRPLLTDGDPRIQELTVAALASLGPAAVETVSDLAKLLDTTRDPAVARNVTLALGGMGKAAAPAVPHLARALDRSRPREVRLYAAEALKRVESPGLDPAIPALLQVIRNDTDPTLRQRAIFAVSEVDDLRRVRAVETLMECLKETEPGVAVVGYAAAINLAFHLREGAPDRAADVLAAMLRDRTLVARSYADVTVGAASSEGRTGTTKVQEENRGDARWLAAEALGAMGRKANRREILDALRAAARDDGEKLRTTAIRALDRIRRSSE